MPLLFIYTNSKRICMKGLENRPASAGALFALTPAAVLGIPTVSDPMNVRLLWLGYIVNGFRGFVRNNRQQRKRRHNNDQKPAQKLKEGFCKILLHLL